MQMHGNLLRNESVEAEKLVPDLNNLIQNSLQPEDIGVANGIGSLDFEGKQPISEVNWGTITEDVSTNPTINAIRKNNYLYGIIDRYTGEEFSAVRATTVPVFGNAITDADVDNIIYFKYGTEYFKRVFKDITPNMFGAVGDFVEATSIGTDNGEAFQKAVDAIYKNGGGVLKLINGNYLVNTTVYINYTGGRPISIKTDISNQKNTSAVSNGVALFRTVAGDTFKVNLKEDGTNFLGESAQYTSFAASGFHSVATVAGANLFHIFRSRSNIQNISSYGYEWTVLQDNADSGGKDNYCDQSIYKFIKVGAPRTGGLRLYKPDSTHVSEIYFEGDAFAYTRGVELVGGTGLVVQNLLQWYQSGSAPDHEFVVGSRFLNIAGCTGVVVQGLHIEHCPHETMINIASSVGVTIMGIHDRFSRKNGITMSSGCQGIQIIGWDSDSDILDSGQDIVTTNALVNDILYTGCKFKSFTGDVIREIAINALGLSSVREISRYKDLELTHTSSFTAKANSTNVLGSPTANSVITLPSISNNKGKEMTFYNRNTTSFIWQFDIPVKDLNGNDLVVIKPNSVMTIELASTTNSGWRVKSEYIDPVFEVVAGTDANFTIPRTNYMYIVPVLTANRVLTLPDTSLNKGKAIHIMNGNTSNFTLTTNLTLTELGSTTNIIPNQTSIVLISDGANWRVAHSYILNIPQSRITTTYTVTPDSDYTIPGVGTITQLSTITANRNLTLPSASGNIGKYLTILNRNTGAFVHNVVSPYFRATDGSNITSVASSTSYILISDGNVWRVIASGQIIAAVPQYVTNNNTGSNPTKANLNAAYGSYKAGSIITYPVLASGGHTYRKLTDDSASDWVDTNWSTGVSSLVS